MQACFSWLLLRIPVLRCERSQNGEIFLQETSNSHLTLATPPTPLQSNDPVGNGAKEGISLPYFH